MSASIPTRTTSVKLTPVGRVLTCAVNESVSDVPVPGAPVVVQQDGSTAIAVTVRPIPAVEALKPPAARGDARVIRLATREDILLRQRQQRREQEALRVAVMKARERGLGMKFTRVEQAFDEARLVFYFTAEGRIDFRELVRELAAEFHTRIEMRQIGVRDEAKMLGGYGTCGRPLCCTTFLNAFDPVSIKMAKQQDLSLNPSKLSGLCGRLKCCLRYELPNARGEAHGGCGSEAGCGNPSGCGCSSGAPGGCACQ